MLGVLRRRDRERDEREDRKEHGEGEKSRDLKRGIIAYARFDYNSVVCIRKNA